MDITEVILHQHGEQRRMFSMLEEWPRDDNDGLKALWKRLEILLEVHAEAEERFFYPELVKLGKGAGDADSVEEEVEDAIKDHNEIREAIRAVRRSAAGSEGWWKAVTEANLANSDHMAEEERQDLTDFRQQTELELRHEIAVQFLRFEAEHWSTGVKPVDKDPEEFVEQNESY
ncbi:MAG TPA: hemerythrin domain-containing protein [Lapillicoccus sp.]|nr:hemerythrin domain-containing protein [Lapillicoccus sp.]